VSKVNFNTDKTVAKKADELAKETADEWCKENEEWEYTGVWKNERSEEDETIEVSHFEVRKKTLPETAVVADVKPIVMVDEDPKVSESGKRPVVTD